MKFVVVLLILTLAVLVVVPARSQEVLIVTYQWGTANQQIRPRPGYANVPFTVEVVQMPNVSVLYGQLNLQGTPVKSTVGGPYAYAAPESAQSEISLSNSSVLPGISIPTVTSGSTATFLTFYLSVPQNSKPGDYPSLLTLVYRKSGVTNDYITYVNLTIYAPEKPELIDPAWISGNGSSFPYPGSGLEDLGVYLSNPSSVPLLGVNVTLFLPRGVLGLNGKSITSFQVPYVGPRGIAQLQFPLNVTSAALVGNQLVRANISFEDYFGGHYFNDTSFNVMIYARPDVALFASKGHAEVGGVVNLSLTVSVLSSSPIYHVAVQPEFQPFELISGNLSSISSIGGKGNATLRYAFYVPENVPPGIYPVMFTVYYGDPLQSAVQCTTYVTVAQQAQNLSISLSPAYAYYDRNDTLLVKLTNSGSSVYGVQVSLEPVQGLYVAQGSGPWSVGTLNKGETAVLTLSVIPSIPEPGSLPLEFIVTYRNSLNYTEEAQLTAPLFLKGLIKIYVTSLSAPTAAVNGTNATISGILLNEGTSEAYYVNVGLWPYNWSQQEYIGSLPADSPTPFSLSVSIPKGAHGTYQLYINITYQDSLGNSYAYSYPVNISVRQQASRPHGAKNNTLIYTIAGAVIVIAAASYVVIRRRRPKS
ncbi:hypothetical protein PQ610_00130 [Tardisphaera miroshnichenkoae]